MGLKVLVPLLTLFVILPWSSGNPSPVSLSGNVARSMHEMRDKLHDANNEGTHSLNVLSPNLWRRDGNPGEKICKYKSQSIQILPSISLRSVYYILMYISDFTDSCSMATTDKCNRVVPPDGADPFNYTSLFEVNTIIFRLTKPQMNRIKH